MYVAYKVNIGVHGVLVNEEAPWFSHTMCVCVSSGILWQWKLAKQVILLHDSMMQRLILLCQLILWNTTVKPWIKRYPLLKCHYDQICRVQGFCIFRKLIWCLLTSLSRFSFRAREDRFFRLYFLRFWVNRAARSLGTRQRKWRQAWKGKLFIQINWKVAFDDNILPIFACLIGYPRFWVRDAAILQIIELVFRCTATLWARASTTSGRDLLRRTGWISLHNFLLF